MNDDELDKIRDRHERADADVRIAWHRCGLHAHEDRAALLAEVERLREENRHHRVTAMDRVSRGLHDAAIAEQATEIERLRAELERAQMQIVACGVVAQANSPENAAMMRATIAAAYRTDSLRCVEAAVDREMALRTDAAALRGALASVVSRHVHENNSHHPEWVAARAALARTGGAS